MKRAVVMALMVLVAAFAPMAFAEKWSGVDETVVNKIAKEHGREARAPLIDTDQGDVLLFVFLVAGAAGGFVAGYSWRKLTEAGGRRGNRREGTHGPV